VLHHLKKLITKPTLGIALAMTASLGLGAAPAYADSYPDRQIRFVVPYSPGGPLDIAARLLAENVSKTLKQVIVVENVAGAGGAIGANAVAKAEPDGYRLVMGAVSTHAISPWLRATLPYHPIKDFSPVILVADVPNVLIINKAFASKEKIKSLADLIAYARKNPDLLNFSSGSNGSIGHLAGELLKERSGILAQHIPYQGAAPAQLALVSGDVHIMFDNLASASGVIKSGTVDALAVTTKNRSLLLPEVPTVEQAGVPDFDLGTWFGIFAPANTPPAIIERLNDAYAQAMRDPEIKKRLLAMGSDAEPASPDAFAQRLKQDLDKYEHIVKASGAQTN
jgi:tripartite-type tricarboxylate transporter receptor subunit TctC